MVALKSARVLFGSFVFTSWAFAAQAQTCEKNEDCPRGTSCHEETSARECPPVAPCDGAKDCATPAPCGGSVVTHECRPASCEHDADCGANMVCFEHKSTECVGGTTAAPCGPNEKCEPATPAPEMCTETSEKVCTPRYVLPCQEAADCGAGFSCESDRACSCSGSSATPPVADAGASKAAFAAPRPAADGGSVPACECHDLETKHCTLTTTTCQADADCPSDFACVTYAGGSTDCAVSKDGDAAVCGASLPSDAVKMCSPRYDWSGGGRVAAEDSGHSSSAPSASNDDPRVPDAGVYAADGGGVTMPPESSACSVTNPGARAGRVGALLGFVLLALGVSRRKRVT